MNKIDLIIDALSVAQNSVWSTLNQEALAYAIELKVELSKPTLPMSPERLPRYVATNNIKPMSGGGGAGGELAKPEQEPIGWFLKDHLETYMESYKDIEGAIPLYTSPPRKEWVGLSVNEGRDFFESKLTRAELITEINEFLEEKNT
jgi:hypothetical protein